MNKMSGMKKAIGGSIHRIREFELEKVNLIDEFDILQIVGEGWFGKILLTEHRSTQTEMVLKALPKAYTGLSDFFREFHYGLHLAAHKNIITTYDVAFETAGFYVFSQEYAPLGDLTSNVTETGLGELHAKRVARQLAAAVQHIHSRDLVHRDIKLDNILVFRSDFSRIKLCDFGETRRVNTVVRRHNEWLPYSPPEILQIDTDETYKARTSHDVWQFGIVLFVCLTGCMPWQKAALDDPRYTRYQNWHNATLNIAKKPKLFQLISSRAQRMFKRLLDPKAEKRPVSVLEINKYLEDRWLAKLGAEKALNGGADERDELCPSLYSFHSSLEEKNQLLHTLTTYGIETTVDRTKKKDRIREWIQSSAIVEENEEDESDIYEDSEFYEDEDRDNNGRESEEAEPITMRSRHFPERRPSATRNDFRKKQDRSVSSASKSRQSVKPMERKIPFAPQVAEERETIARFASFPNGDPNLATVTHANNQVYDISTNLTNNAPDISPRINNLSADNKQVSSISSTNERNIKDPVKININTSQNDSSPFPMPMGVASFSTSNQSPLRNTSDIRVRNSEGNGIASGTLLPRSPQIPARRNRAHTAPFADVSSSRLAENWADSAKRAQSATVLHTSEVDRSPLPIRAPTKLPMQYTTNNVASSSISRTRSNAASLPIARTDVIATPIINSDISAETQSSKNTVFPGRSKNSPPNAMQKTPMNTFSMSVASQLVMQSFNTLQSIANSGTTSASTVSPMSSSSPSNSLSNVNRAVQETIYGKDVYEHYGIAQGTILPMKSNIVRQDSTGSGSRSVSN